MQLIEAQWAGLQALIAANLQAQCSSLQLSELVCKLIAAHWADLQAQYSSLQLTELICKLNAAHR